MSYDNVCKFLSEQYPADIVRWLLSREVEDIQLLKTELSQEPIRADSVTFLQTANQILHLEFQTLAASKPPLPFRMLDYSVRLKREYGMDVEQVVIFLQQTTSDVAYTDRYHDRTTTHYYRAVRLWEQDPAIFFANPTLLPFATLAKTTAPPKLLREIAQRVARIEDRRQRVNLISCVEILAGLRFEKSLIRQLFREDIMQESVIYQDILQQGVQQGVQQGLQQGLQQGQEQEALSLVLRQLNRRLGVLPSTTADQIRQLLLPQLEALGEALLDFSQMTDLVAWLEQAEQSAES